LGKISFLGENIVGGGCCRLLQLEAILLEKIEKK
jgi:hypothetical protein